MDCGDAPCERHELEVEGRVPVGWRCYMPMVFPQDDPELLVKIDAWHDGAGEGQALHEYLGLTQEQFAAWLEGRSQS